MPKFRGPNVPDRFGYPELFDAGNTDLDGTIIKEGSRYVFLRWFIHTSLKFSAGAGGTTRVRVYSRRQAKASLTYFAYDQGMLFGIRTRRLTSTGVSTASFWRTLSPKRAATRTSRMSGALGVTYPRSVRLSSATSSSSMSTFFLSYIGCSSF